MHEALSATGGRFVDASTTLDSAILSFTGSDGQKSFSLIRAGKLPVVIGNARMVRYLDEKSCIVETDTRSQLVDIQSGDVQNLPFTAASWRAHDQTLISFDAGTIYWFDRQDLKQLTHLNMSHDNIVHAEPLEQAVVVQVEKGVLVLWRDGSSVKSSDTIPGTLTQVDPGENRITVQQLDRTLGFLVEDDHLEPEEHYELGNEPASQNSAREPLVAGRSIRFSGSEVESGQAGFLRSLLQLWFQRPIHSDEIAIVIPD